jgi:hypothetical protein
MPALTPHPMLTGLACVISRDTPNDRLKMTGMQIIIHIKVARESVIVISNAIVNTTPLMIKRNK